MAQKESAGLLMYTREGPSLRVLLAHPGGPLFARKDEGYWTIPKGELSPGETPLICALREFEEETGLKPEGALIALESVRQKGGKIVYAWAFAGEWASGTRPQSNTFPLEWPPHSGKTEYFPEIDRAEMFTLPEAKVKINAAQVLFLERLEENFR